MKVVNYSVFLKERQQSLTAFLQAVLVADPTVEARKKHLKTQLLAFKRLVPWRMSKLVCIIRPNVSLRLFLVESSIYPREALSRW